MCKADEWYEMKQFEDEMKVWGEYVVPASRSVYDYVDCDSRIEKEFVEDLEKWDFVKLYLKLPRWFTVPTPVGEYNPDWALVIEQPDEFGQAVSEHLIYLVSETKGTRILDELRNKERQKVKCGERHFEGAMSGLEYKLAVTANDLR